MKNKVILIVLTVIGVIIVGGAITRIRQPGIRRSEDIIAETGSEKYEDLKSEILDMLGEFNDEGLNATQLDDVLSIELFELEPENENLGEIY
jgi:hypothetical protein